MTVQDVLAAASQLSQEERLQVAIRLLESLRESYSVSHNKIEPTPSWTAGLPQLVQSADKAVPSGNQGFQALQTNHPQENLSLHDLLSQSPFSRLDFEAESIKPPVRAVEF
ncbi:hypothetical protein C7271_21735 [filamentous cyanobacterium CCP5]|nr:hypothetical protein C7271_21735 [filamentous cyanobacterium CCP5]